MTSTIAFNTRPFLKLCDYGLDFKNTMFFHARGLFSGSGIHSSHSCPLLTKPVQNGTFLITSLDSICPECGAGVQVVDDPHYGISDLLVKSLSDSAELLHGYLVGTSDIPPEYDEISDYALWIKNEIRRLSWHAELLMKYSQPANRLKYWEILHRHVFNKYPLAVSSLRERQAEVVDTCLESSFEHTIKDFPSLSFPESAKRFKSFIEAEKEVLRGDPRMFLVGLPQERLDSIDITTIALIFSCMLEKQPYVLVPFAAWGLTNWTSIKAEVPMGLDVNTLDDVFFKTWQRLMGDGGIYEDSSVAFKAALDLSEV